MSKTSNSNVCHAWAHGQAAESGNMSTDGTRLHSYKTLIGYNTSKGLVFITADGWTPTTKKQLCGVRHAVRHLDVIQSPYFRYGSKMYDFNENEAFKTTCEALNSTIEGYNKARLSKYLNSSVQHAYELATELNGYAVKYGYTPCAFYQIDFDRRKAIRNYSTDYEAAQKHRAEQALINRRHNDEKAFTAWRNGEQVSCPPSYRFDAQGGHYIAVRGDKVVTSGGASCPIEHARRGIAFWKAREHTQAHQGSYVPWQRNGHTVHLGIFQLDSIDEHGTARAGCHKFYANELNRLADLLL